MPILQQRAHAFSRTKFHKSDPNGFVVNCHNHFDMVWKTWKFPVRFPFHGLSTEFLKNLAKVGIMEFGQTVSDSGF